MADQKLNRPTLDAMTLAQLKSERLKQEIEESNNRALSMWSLLRPFVLLALTVLISGYMIPKATQSHQDYQQEINFKSQLSREITVAVSELLQGVQGVEFMYFTEPLANQIRGKENEERLARLQSEFNDAYNKWQTRKRVIEVQIHVNFPDATITEGWHEFSDHVTTVYALTNIARGPYRDKTINELQQYFGAGDDDRWTTLRDLPEEADPENPGGFRRAASRDYYAAWMMLQQFVVKKNSEFVSGLVDADTIAYGK